METRDNTGWEDKDRCATCGGKCCQIYADIRDTHKEYIITSEHIRKKRITVKPVYDREYIHKILRNYYAQKLSAEGRLSTWYMNYREELPVEPVDITPVVDLIKSGVDPTFCQYWDSKTGCLIPREQRPEVCTRYKCPPWSFPHSGSVFILNCTPFIPGNWEDPGVHYVTSTGVLYVLEAVGLPTTYKSPNTICGIR